jgi:hypothetical protein
MLRHANTSSGHSPQAYRCPPKRVNFRRAFDRVFTDGSTEQRFLRETIFGTRHLIR